MKKVSLFSGAIAVALAGGLVLSSQTDLLNQKTPDYITLPSDTFAQVVFIQDPEAQSAYAQLTFPFGEMTNPYAEGLAHYLEHLAYLNAFQETGEKRHAGAWTSSYVTSYSRQIGDDLAKTLAQLSAVADPITLDENFALEERKIVLREHGFRVAENALYDTYLELESVLYDGHPYARSVIGVPSDIANFSLDDAKALHAQSHQLASATLVLSGNLTKRAVKAALKTLPDSPVLEPFLQDPPAPLTPIMDDASVTVPKYAEPLFMYRKLLPLPDCGTPARCYLLLRLTDNMVDSTRPEGIAGPLRFDAFITRSFDLDFDQLDDKLMQISFTAAPDVGVTLDQVQDAFDTALNNSLRNGVSVETFNKIKNRRLDDLDNVDDIPDFNLDAVTHQLSYNQPLYGYSEEIATLETITRNDLNEFLAALQGPGRVVIRKINALN